VVALARSAHAVGVVRAAGAEPVFGDLLNPEPWGAQAASVDRVFHLARPRLNPPLRKRRIGSLVKRSSTGATAIWGMFGDARPVTMVSTGLVAGTGRQPLLARGAVAAEHALADADLRVVRLGWVYGSEGILADLLAALRAGRFRVLGPGDNRWPLIAAADAVEALLAASKGPAGVYAAAEADVPTQVEVIHRVCEAAGLRRPDHLPPAMARFSLGGVMAEALMASTDLRADRLSWLGWRPESQWRRDLPALVGFSPPEDLPSGG
jgi:nucleoside-diphosphate-sugar epimerase